MCAEHGEKYLLFYVQGEAAVVSTARMYDKNKALSSKIRNLWRLALPGFPRQGNRRLDVNAVPAIVSKNRSEDLPIIPF